MCSANGPRTPGLLDSLTVNVKRSIAFRHAQTLGRIQQKPCFRSSIPIRAGRYSLTFHPHYLSVYASTNDFGDTPYTLAATLDTGPVASSYPGGIRTRSSSNYFQSARASDGSASAGFSGLLFCSCHHQNEGLAVASAIILVMDDSSKPHSDAFCRA